MKPNKLELNSVDGTQLNLEALYQIAPSCFTEVKDDKTGELRRVVNFKTLRRGAASCGEFQNFASTAWR